MRMARLTLVTNPTTKHGKGELNLTKKYPVACSTIVLKIPDQPCSSENPAPKLVKWLHNLKP